MWKETKTSLKPLPHPWIAAEWEDNMKKWPQIMYGDSFNNFVLSLGMDGLAIRNYKSTEGYRYLHSGKVGRVLLHQEQDHIFLKASVQRIFALVLVKAGGAVEITYFFATN